MEARVLVSAIRRFWWLIIALGLVGVCLGGALGYLSARVYQAGSSVEVSAADLTLIEGGAGSVLDTQQYDATQVGVIESDNTLQPVARSLGLPLPSVAKAISVSQRQSSDIIDIVATYPTPAGAAAIANAVARQYITQQVKDLNSEIGPVDQRLTLELKAIQNQINNPNTAPAAEAGLQTRYSSVDLMLNNAQTTQNIALANTRVVENAIVPLSPKPRHTVVKAGLGFVGGLMIGLIFSVVLAAMRPRMLRGTDVEDAIGITAAAELPHVPAWRGVDKKGIKRLSWQEHAGFADEMAKVGVFVEAARSARNCKTVLVTSLERGAGVSTVASALTSLLGENNRVVKHMALPSMHVAEPRPGGQLWRTPGKKAQVGGQIWGSLEVPERIGDPLDRPPLVGAGAFLLPTKLGSQLEDAEYDADLVVIDGGSLRESVSVIALARTLDVTVLVVPLPNQNERYLNAVLRATFDDARGQLLVVTNNVSGQRARRVGASA